jgi:DNA-binding SARP family transcriptional activator/Flp pilus assembly protein TadD
MAILALLARAGERGLSRDKLLAMLWPDAEGDRGSRTLAQALYALRKELAAEDAITGARDLRFDPALVATDVGEFTSALSRGDYARAAELYDGPFLDGFHLAGVDEFNRWVERERAALVQDYTRVLESLARKAGTSGDAGTSVTWWRKLAAVEPLNARVTVGLMEALAAAGDRATAIKHARIYELLVEQELELPPDREVMALADRLRAQREPEARPAVAEAPSPTAPAAATMVALEPPSDTEPLEAERVISVPSRPVVIARELPEAAAHPALGTPGGSSWRRPGRWAVAGVAAGIVAVSLFAARSDGSRRFLSSGASPIVAVGRIVSYGADSAATAMAGPVADLLATSLARSPGLRVVSAGRMMELMRRMQRPGDTTGGDFVAAARQAGATEVIDGTLYTRPTGALRLDLRRVDLATGAIGDVRTIEGNDLFTLVDSGTVQLVATLGGKLPPGSVTDVTTHSVVAYRMHEQGVDAFFRNDLPAALRLFDGALAEDSLFALAAYYGALAVSSFGPDSYMPRMHRAQRLAVRAPDRERLTILADWNFRTSAPTLRQVAETLATRYPSEIEGHLYTGIALVNEGEFLAARQPLERVIAMDSLAPRRGVTCGLCVAAASLVSAYLHADSTAAAERTARRWLHLQPGASPALDALINVLDREGRVAEADSIATAARADLNYEDAVYNRVLRHIRIGDYEEADRLALPETRHGSAVGRVNAYWTLAISLREQGRLDEAFDAARRLRQVARAAWTEGPVSWVSVLEAQVQLERGQVAVASALFDSLVRARPSISAPSQLARDSAWRLTHLATARAAAGDTATVERLAGLVQTLGARSGFGRDRRLHHHIRGLLLVARGDTAAAIAEFREAIFSLSSGYTRTNLELAKIYLRQGRPREAVAVLQPALRGSIEAHNLYVNRTELQDLLARAWDAAGVRDSAVAHYQVVARAWSAGDPPFRARADSARVRAARPR